MAEWRVPAFKFIILKGIRGDLLHSVERHQGEHKQKKNWRNLLGGGGNHAMGTDAIKFNVEMSWHQAYTETAPQP